LKESMIRLLKYLFHHLAANGKLLRTLIILTIFTALFQSLQSPFSKTTLTKIPDALLYIVLIIFPLNTFYLLITYPTQTIQTILHFILPLFPIFLPLIATPAGLVSVSFFHPLIIFLINT
ncbi:stage III sporulation protein AE, partial [Bacillus thuringiensis]|uniref:stage III sporulation protein AE n=1 Tax=Bacillus thuringiensis TaxID=1428 RepID=UPI003BFA66D4